MKKLVLITFTGVLTMFFAASYAESKTEMPKEEMK